MYGSETHGLRREERSLVAREYPSIKLYRRILTPYQQEKAKAGKFFLSGPNALNKIKPGQIVLALILLRLWQTRGQ